MAANPMPHLPKPHQKALRSLVSLGLTFLTLALLWLALDLQAGASDPLPPVEHPDGRAGACYSFYYGQPPDRPYLPMAYDAGARWDRFDFAWWRLEPTEGAWDPLVVEGYDALVADLDEADMHMVGILLGTPSWAATGGVEGMGAPSSDKQSAGRNIWTLDGSASSTAASPPQGLHEAWDDWTTDDGDPINYWGRFVYTTVARYSDTVKHWEMWNEPDWSVFWTGTVTDYAQLLRVGYRATNAACPDCTVLFGGLQYWIDPGYSQQVLDVLAGDPAAAQHDYFFDAMSVHLYSRPSDIYNQIEKLRSGMSAYGVGDHPIWLTETGVPVWDDASVDPTPSPYGFAATQAEAAAYVLQSYANAWAADVARYFFFRTHDADMAHDPILPEFFGLVRNDGSRRPAYAAYQVATSYLVSPTMVTRRVHPSGTRQVTLWGTPHGKVSALWNATPETITFGHAATLPTATLVDRHGSTRTITATSGVYSLTLPGATAFVTAGTGSRDYFIGGDPYLLIEGDTTPPPTATVQPLPSVTNALTLAIASQANDDAAGVMGYELQVRVGDDGPWETWPGLHQTPIPFTDPAPQSVNCFRVRAWDRAGNPGPWPNEAQTCTMYQGSRLYFPLIAREAGAE